MPFTSRLRSQRKPFSLVVDGAPDATTVSRKDAYLINHDLRPVPPAERTWSARNYVLFWAADSVNLSSMMIAATGVVAGMTWWQTFLAVFLGYSLTAIFVVLSSRVGASTHCGFPVLARPAFGLYGAIWPVINRVVVAILWFAFQTYIGGQCMTLLLRSLAPRYLQTTAGQLSGITRPEFIGFLLFWIVQFPLMFITPQKIRHLFTVKAYVAPIAVFGLLGWTVSQGGTGPVISRPATISGSELGWQFVITTMSQMANMITLALNAADFARLSTSRSAVTWPQLITIPLLFSVISLIGIFISSSSQELFQTEESWNTLNIMDQFLLIDPYDSASRAGVFFISLSFIVAQLGTNIAANSICVGSDLTSLLPRYINIVRGQVFCALVSLAICPWYFASSSSSFGNYLSAYSVLLAPILGVILSDAYILRRGWIHVPSLFSWESTTAGFGHEKYGEVGYEGSGSGRVRGMYTFNGIGVNYRAYIAYLAGCALNLPGFVSAVSTSATVPEGLVRVYNLAFFTGSLCAGIIYLAINAFHPVEGSVALTQKGWKGISRQHEVDFDGRPFDSTEVDGHATSGASTGTTGGGLRHRGDSTGSDEKAAVEGEVDTKQEDGQREHQQKARVEDGPY